MKSPDVSLCLDNTVDLSCFKELLLQTFGHTFDNEREQTLASALCRRMVALRISRHDAYHACLLRDHNELLRLVELLTVNETYFFREPEHLNLMVEILPKLMAGRHQRPIRILSAGCSTGEEPYSVAILLRERFGMDSEHLFAITGVDIDSQVITTAKQGIYGESSFRGMDNILFKRYFRPLGHGKFRLDPTLCKQVEFDVVNLLDTAYSHHMQSPDLILYRNVSIYFPGAIQQQIFRQLAHILVKGGYLIVGATETMHHDVSILSLVKQGSLFVYRKTPHTVYQHRRVPPAPSEYAPPSERRIPPLTPAPHQDPATEGRLLGQLPGRQTVPVGHKPLTDSQSAQERYETALDLARHHRADESLALLGAVIQQDATCAKAYTLKAHLLLNASRFDELVDVCRLAIDQDIRCPTLHLMLGMAARHRGDDNDALKRLREAIYLDASCWLAHFLSAEIHYGQGDKKRSRSGYEAAARILDKAAKDASCDLDREFFPLAFNADQFVVICRHKLSLLNSNTL